MELQMDTECNEYPSHDANVIADWFIRRHGKEGKKLTILKLLKLVYIAHGWHLESFDRPLIRNRIEAWKYGPVIPDVYNAYRSAKRNVMDVECTGVSSEEEIGEKQAEFLEEVYSIYGDVNASTLSWVTHLEGTPWDITYKRKGYRGFINDDVIKMYYRGMRTGEDE